MSADDTDKPFALTMFEFNAAQEEFLDKLELNDFTGIDGDHYDASIEIRGVGNDERLSEAQQRVIFDAGFAKAYLNHKDGWETHYGWGKTFVSCRGWRRKCTEDGKFLISYWPESWNSDRTKDWLSTGFMTIVPDPLDSKNGQVATIDGESSEE